MSMSLPDPFLEPEESNPLFELSINIMRESGDVQQYRLGRILTIVDAIVADQEQRKAMKDLVRDAFHSREYYTENINSHLYEFAEKYLPEMAKKSTALNKGHSGGTMPRAV